MKINKKRIIMGAVAAVALSGLVFAGATAFSLAKDNTVIPAHVSVAGVDVAGMSRQQAIEAVDAFIEEQGEKKITLIADEKKVKVPAGELGLSADASDAVDQAMTYGASGNLIERYKDQLDIKNGVEKNFPIIYTVDRYKTENYIEEKSEKLSQKAVDNGLKRENGEFVFIKGKNGVTVKTEESAEKVVEYVESSFSGDGDKVELAIDIEEPKGKEEELKAIQDVLGSYSTNFSASSAARANNVRNGASLINGAVIYPGDTFSVAEALNPMTAENGYQPAPSYENGTTVMTYGGGICQVSTTLYNAVIRAELEVVERSNHSMIVTYVKPSEDAAIAGTSKDFKFKNNLDNPIYIEGYTDGGIIYFNVYGKETRDPGRTVEFESEVLSTTQPKNVFHADGGSAIGSIVRTSGTAHTGYVARLWKIVKQDGKEVSRDVFNNSSYRATNNEYSVGVRSESAEASAAMRAAVSSGNLGTIQSAAAKWRNAKPDTPEEDKKEDQGQKEEEKPAKQDTTDNSKKDDGAKQDEGAKQDTATEKTNTQIDEEV